MAKYIYTILSFVLASGMPAYAADLFDTVKRSGEISTFVKVIDAADMAGLLKEPGPYTVFAPTNSAFGNLSPEKREALLSDKERAAQFVSDHIIPGKLPITEMVPGDIRTVDGSVVHMELDVGLLKIDNASVILSDLEADNGVLHIVDAIITPGR